MFARFLFRFALNCHALLDFATASALSRAGALAGRRRRPRLAWSDASSAVGGPSLGGRSTACQRAALRRADNAFVVVCARASVAAWGLASLSRAGHAPHRTKPASAQPAHASAALPGHSICGTPSRRGRRVILRVLRCPLRPQNTATHAAPTFASQLFRQTAQPTMRLRPGAGGRAVVPPRAPGRLRRRGVRRQNLRRHRQRRAVVALRAAGSHDVCSSGGVERQRCNRPRRSLRRHHRRRHRCSHGASGCGVQPVVFHGVARGRVRPGRRQNDPAVRRAVARLPGAVRSYTAGTLSSGGCCQPGDIS